LLFGFAARIGGVYDPRIRANDPPPTDALHQHPVAAGNVAPRIGDRFDPGLFELVPELDDLRVLISPLAPEFPDLLVGELRPFELP
jgi:hypothetical protein